MEDSQFKVMEYLYGKTGKIDRDLLAADLAYYFGEHPNIWKEMSILNDKKLIDRDLWSPIGKFNEVFLKEQQIRKTQSFVSELQFNELSKKVEKLDSDLDDAKGSKRRSQAAIILSIVIALLTIIRMMMGK